MNIQNTAIDSLKLRIPYENISFKDDETKKRYTAILQQVNKKTGELLKNKPEKYKKKIEELDKKDISVTFQVGSLSIPNFKKWNDRKETIKDYLFLTINSKLLKENYLQGLTKENILQCYSEIMEAQQDITFSDSELINAECVDVDIKTDIHTNDTLEKTKNTLKELENITENGNLTIGKKAQSLSFYTRHKSNNVINKPYLKFYNKNLELEHNSKNFCDNFLSSSPELETSILRLEGTIKNKNHWQSLYKSITGNKPDSFRLHEILELNSKQKEEIISLMLAKYLKLESKKYTKSKGDFEMQNIKECKKNERGLYREVYQSIARGLTIDETIKLIKITEPKKTYYRQKKLIEDKIYPMLQRLPKMQSKINQNKTIEAILSLGK